MATEESSADWRKVKRTRGIQTGCFTKLQNKLQALYDKGISSYDFRVLDRAHTTITETEAAFKQTVEDAATILDVDTDDKKSKADEAAEELAQEAFTEKAADVINLVDEMLILKQTHLSLEDLRTDVEAFQTSITAMPELYHSKALNKIETAFAKIRKTTKKSKVKPDHPTRQEINSFSTLLTRLSSQIETSTASAAPSTTPIIIRSKDSDKTCDLPKIGIPEFHGDIMEWALFWAQFEAAIDSHERLCDVPTSERPSKTLIPKSFFRVELRQADSTKRWWQS